MLVLQCNVIDFFSNLCYNGLIVKIINHNWLLTALVLLLILAVLTGGRIFEAAVSFFVAGVVHGTRYNLPIWAMLGLYALTAVLIVTSYVRTLRKFIKANTKFTPTRPIPPRRRYSNA